MTAYAFRAVNRFFLTAVIAFTGVSAHNAAAFDAAETAKEFAARTVAAAPEDWQLGLQPALSPVMEDMVSFHNIMLVLIFAIAIFVMALLAYVCVRFRAKKNPVPSHTSHHTLLEVVWTVVPVVILVGVSVKSLQTLYHANTVPAAEVTLKVTGYQWYWEYHYPDEGINFVSNMLSDEQLEEVRAELDKIGSDAPVYRLLETDNVVVLPVDTDIRVQLTGADVIHSWALPALGIKTDTVPGRLNETWMRINKEGYYFGQCSELCGRLHAFMPVTVKAVSKEAYAAWVEQAKAEFGAVDTGASSLLASVE